MRTFQTTKSRPFAFIRHCGTKSLRHKILLLSQYFTQSFEHDHSAALTFSCVLWSKQRSQNEVNALLFPMLFDHALLQKASGKKFLFTLEDPPQIFLQESYTTENTCENPTRTVLYFNYRKI